MTLLRVRSISKSYPGVQALAGVDLSVDAGEVHALLGQNGAGKSTLMKILAGSESPDDGSVELDGEEISLGSPERARDHGFGIVYQELSLVPQLSIAENVLMARWRSGRFGWLIGWKETTAEAERHLRRVGFDTDPKRAVSELGMAERQLVELAKALSTGPRVLLLDEPTSALSDREAPRLFEIIRDLTGQGVAVIYVSHRLQELVTISDRVSVLRDGELVDTVKTSDVDEAKLARMMVGGATTLMTESATGRERRPRGVPALRAAGLSRAPRLKDVDLEVDEGEVVTVFGLVGAGRSRLAKTLFGLEPATAGSLEIQGAPCIVRSPVDAINAGMGYVGEDRQGGLVPKMSVASNITLASFGDVSHGPLLNFDAERAEASQQVADLSIRTASVDAAVSTLSGGNQQKVVLARWSCAGARVLLLDDPTKGIDVAAKEEVFRLVRRLADEGAAVLYLTSEIREARALGDRLLVMANGTVVATFDPQTSEEEIMAAAGGAGV